MGLINYCQLKQSWRHSLTQKHPPPRKHSPSPQDAAEPRTVRSLWCPRVMERAEDAEPRYMRQRQLPAGPVGWESQTQRYFKCHPSRALLLWDGLWLWRWSWETLPISPGLGSVLSRMHHMEENKTHSSREKDEIHGISHLPKPLLLVLCKSAKSKSESTM